MTVTQKIVTPSIEIRSVAWDDPDAVALRDAMTAEVAPRYADRLAHMPPPAEMFVQPDQVIYTAVAYDGPRSVGHIALRYLPVVPSGTENTENTDIPDETAEFEIKRMFVDPSVRGRGVARLLLSATENAALAKGARRVVLQTGDRQPEAAALYTSAGYTRIPLLAPYLALPYSLCFEKPLRFT
jgi:GNAT superfamily N-acetyltransferase